MLTEGDEQVRGEVHEIWYRIRHVNGCGGVACWYVSDQLVLSGTRMIGEGFRLCDGTRPDLTTPAPAICGQCGIQLGRWLPEMFEEVDPLTVAITAARWEGAVTLTPCSTTPPPEDLPTATEPPTTPLEWLSSQTRERDPPADPSAS